jgi:thioredoxin 2
MRRNNNHHTKILLEHMMTTQNTYKLRCQTCQAKNNIPSEKINSAAKCGKCGTSLNMRELLINEPLAITEEHFDATVKHSGLPLLIYCWAPWCGTCQSVNPMITELARTMQGRIKVIKLNIDQNQTLANRFQIMSVPFFLIFDNGKLQDRFPGTHSKHDVLLKMAHYI